MKNLEKDVKKMIKSKKMKIEGKHNPGDEIKLSRKLYKNISKKSIDFDNLLFKSKTLENELSVARNKIWLEIYKEYGFLSKYSCFLCSNNSKVKIIGKK